MNHQYENDVCVRCGITSSGKRLKDAWDLHSMGAISFSEMFGLVVISEDCDEVIASKVMDS